MNQKANTSMILGICGIIFSFVAYGFLAFAVFFSLGVAAIVFSVLAKKEMKHMKNQGKGKGKGQATAGLVMGIIIVVITIMSVLGYIIITNVDITSRIYCAKEMGFVNNCVPNEDGKTATCEFMGEEKMPCYLDVLDETQIIKKEEK